MTSEPLTPVVRINRSDEPEAVDMEVLLGERITDENFASEKSVYDQVMMRVIPLCRMVRIDRASLEEEWRAIMRMEYLQHDEGQRYKGRSNAYLPVFTRVQKSQVSALAQGLFPSDEYFDVADLRTGDPERARPLKQYVQWEMERVAQVRRRMKWMLKPLVEFGNTVFKVWYDKPIRKPKRGLARFMQGAQAPNFSNLCQYEGARVSARSIFHWYIYPLESEDLQSAQLVFEDVPVPRDTIEQMGRSGRWENVEDLMVAPPPDNWQLSNTEQRELFHHSSLTQPTFGYSTLNDSRVLTEAWCYLKLPRRAYAEDEDKEAPVLCKVIFAGNFVAEVRRDPFAHGTFPYLVARTEVHPGMFYGSGQGRLARALQYLANDFANQTNDVGAYTLNPVVIRNMAYVGSNPLKPLFPGVAWDVLDINQAVKFERPPWELMQAGLNMLNAIIGMEQDFSGSPPIAQGIGARGAAKTATGAQILQRNALTPLQDVLEDVEADVMVPLLYMVWINAMQYRDKNVMATVAGEQINVDPMQLALDAEFRWLASSQAVNRAQRTQQMMSLLQGIMPLIPLMVQNGYVIDPVDPIKRIWTDGFGLRGFSSFIRKAEAVPGGAQPGVPLRPDQVGAVANEQQDRIRSALEQAGGMVGEMAPGEGEDFMNVRAQGDELAGMLGGMMGQA
jgi:hypothetical protein